MKTTFNKFLLTLLILMVNTAIFAQPNPDPDTGDPNPTDAPIDSNIYVLLIIGLLFVAYKYYRKQHISKI